MHTTPMPEKVRQELGENAEQTWILFDSMLPPGQQWFTPKNLAGLLKVHERTIRNAFNNPSAAHRILGFSFNFGGSTEWDRKLFPRWAVVMALIKRANFDLVLLMGLLDELVDSLTFPALEHTYLRAKERMKKIQPR